MATKILGKVALTPKGEFNELTEYQVLDIISYQGSSYVCLQTTKGNLPTNDTYWQLVAEKGDKGEQGDKGDKGDKGDTGEIPEGTIESDDVDSIEVVDTLPEVEQTNVLYLVKESVYLDSTETTNISESSTETEVTNE